MAKFEFGRKTINLEICNKTYTIEDNTEFSDKLNNFRKKMEEQESKIDVNSEDYDYFMKLSTYLCDEYYKLIDSILGENASKEIFKDRMYDIEDAYSLLIYLDHEIAVQRAQRMNKYSNSRIERSQIKKQKFKKRR